MVAWYTDTTPLRRGGRPCPPHPGTAHHPGGAYGTRPRHPSVVRDLCVPPKGTDHRQTRINDARYRHPSVGAGLCSARNPAAITKPARWRQKTADSLRRGGRLTPRALAPPSAHSSRGVAGAVRPSLGSVTQKGRSKAPPLRTTSCLPATNETLSRFRRRAIGPAGASAPTILSHYRCSFTVPTMAPKVPPLSSSAPVRAKATSVINSRSRFRSAVHTR